ncbi:hypothetical protein [Defluviimonas sp. WL0075]|uniref:DUF1127 domain-containing protein n=1 Tax=Albidovulum sediminicola TaxID=2984331 RepID=A0ABT2Z089_9RHOB|nr:hypothetical protein [Defluviimonas sp. WL0075]MCV2864559.1 hypothetical protein [Defluviimonas sp. WL0075]
MTVFDDHKPGAPCKPAAPRVSSRRENDMGWWRYLVRILAPQADAARLSPRLRRDAGINDQELEQAKAAKAPLIR